MSIAIFIDTEGLPVQELAALCLKDGFEIIDGYVQYAQCSPSIDSYSRKYIHGLNVHFLQKHGFPNEMELAANFKTWLKKYPNAALFANNPSHERKLLHLPNIQDIGLPNWCNRWKLPSYQLALSAKNRCEFIKDFSCNISIIHSCFHPSIVNHKNSEKTLIKKKHGVHCAFYDCLELCLFYKWNVICK